MAATVRDDRHEVRTRRPTRHGPHRVVARHLVGHHWHGRVTPGASFWEASKHEHAAWFSKKGEPSPWRKTAPWKRAIVWWLVYLSAVGVPLVLLAFRGYEWVLLLWGALIAVALAWALYQKRKRKERPVPGRVSVEDVRRHLV